MIVLRIASLALFVAACSGPQASGGGSAEQCPAGCEPVDRIFERVEKVERVPVGLPPEEDAPPSFPDTSVTMCRYIEDTLRQTGCVYKLGTPQKKCTSVFKRISRKQLGAFPMNPSKTCAAASFPPLLRSQSIQPLPVQGGTLLIEDETFAPGGCPQGRVCKALPVDPLFSKNLVSMKARLPSYLKVQRSTAGPQRWFLVGEIPDVKMDTPVPTEIVAENPAGVEVARFEIIVKAR